MSSMQVNSVLAQIRSLSTQVQGVSNNVSALNPSLKTEQAKPGSFASIMKDGVAQVNQAQLRAGDVANAFERGVPGVELSDVMLEMQKANVSFRALTEVRNRFVSAYQEIMNMPI